MSEVVEIKEFSGGVVEGLDALMHELSPDASASSERVRRVIASPDIHQYAVFREDRMAACATLCVCTTPEMVIGFVEAVVVSSVCRGQGLGRQLMERILADAPTFGVQQLHLTSNPKRVAANALYQKMGFERKETNVYVKKL